VSVQKDQVRGYYELKNPNNVLNLILFLYACNVHCLIELLCILLLHAYLLICTVTATLFSLYYCNSKILLEGHGSGVPESTPAGLCVYLSDPDPDRASLFNLAVAGVWAVICEVKPLVIFCCLNCSRSLNRSHILKFEKFPDPDPNSKVLEQERSQSLEK